MMHFPSKVQKSLWFPAKFPSVSVKFMLYSFLSSISFLLPPKREKKTCTGGFSLEKESFPQKLNLFKHKFDLTLSRGGAAHWKRKRKRPIAPPYTQHSSSTWPSELVFPVARSRLWFFGRILQVLCKYTVEEEMCTYSRSGVARKRRCIEQSNERQRSKKALGIRKVEARAIFQKKSSCQTSKMRKRRVDWLQIIEHWQVGRVSSKNASSRRGAKDEGWADER